MPQIRPYQPETDRDRVLEVWLTASRHGHAFLGEAALRGQLGLVRDVYLVRAETRVAVCRGDILGFIGLLDAFIGGLFVDPAAHRAGIGRALILDAAARRGALTVEVYAANAAALAFYGRLGFVETGRRPLDDEGRPWPLVHLERPADGA